MTHSILLILILLISVLLSGSFTNFIPHIVAAGTWTVYIPTAILLPMCRRGKGVRTRFDSAKGETVYLSAQMICWMTSLVLSILQADQSSCHHAHLYYYPVESSWIQFYGVIESMAVYCHTMIAVSVMSGIHLVVLGGWMVHVVLLVKKWEKVREGDSDKGWESGMHRLVEGNDKRRGEMGGREWKESQERLNEV
ncbi:hypothetical protein IAR55_007038 [Kwoniella newhampshirensis]|uniref:Uncharacterized protein n=1 Tax=Kwoniella newhampshirensis TaxID=1651941 RepID=A0AAW0YDW5_9TREE